MIADESSVPAVRRAPLITLQPRLMADRDHIVRTLASEGVRLCSLIHGNRRFRFTTVVVAPSPDGRHISRHPGVEYINPGDFGVIRCRNWRMTPVPGGTLASRDAVVLSPVSYSMLHPLQVALDLLLALPAKVPIFSPALAQLLDDVFSDPVCGRDLLNRVHREISALKGEFHAESVTRAIWKIGSRERIPYELLSYARLVGARERLLEGALRFRMGEHCDLAPPSGSPTYAALAELLHLSRQPYTSVRAHQAEHLVNSLPTFSVRTGEVPRNDYYRRVDAAGPALCAEGPLESIGCIGKTRPTSHIGSELGWRGHDSLGAIIAHAHADARVAAVPPRPKSLLQRLSWTLFGKWGSRAVQVADRP